MEDHGYIVLYSWLYSYQCYQLPATWRLIQTQLRPARPASGECALASKLCPGHCGMVAWADVATVGLRVDEPFNETISPLLALQPWFGATKKHSPAMDQLDGFLGPFRTFEYTPIWDPDAAYAFPRIADGVVDVHKESTAALQGVLDHLPPVGWRSRARKTRDYAWLIWLYDLHDPTIPRQRFKDCLRRWLAWACQQSMF